jgi:cytochrome c-type biogenesis protein CcmH
MRLFIFLLLALQLNFSHARVEFREFERAELEERYNVLGDELRCLVCQNQNLKGSNSDLAKDMRNKVYQMISAEKTNKEIVDYMVERYGDFVLYKPPFKPITLMLWLGPLVFFIIALVSVLRVVKQRNKADAIEALTDEEHQRAQALLKKDEAS